MNDRSITYNFMSSSVSRSQIDLLLEWKGSPDQFLLSPWIESILKPQDELDSTTAATPWIVRDPSINVKKPFSMHSELTLDFTLFTEQITESQELDIFLALAVPEGVYFEGYELEFHYRTIDYLNFHVYKDEAFSEKLTSNFNYSQIMGFEFLREYIPCPSNDSCSFQKTLTIPIHQNYRIALADQEYVYTNITFPMVFVRKSNPFLTQHISKGCRYFYFLSYLNNSGNYHKYYQMFDLPKEYYLLPSNSHVEPVTLRFPVGNARLQSFVTNITMLVISLTSYILIYILLCKK